MKITLDAVCRPSGSVVAREVDGEVIIVPLTAAIGDAEDEIYGLNDTAKAIWSRLDGRHSLSDVVSELSGRYRAAAGMIERDVLGLVAELERRGIVEVR